MPGNTGGKGARVGRHHRIWTGRPQVWTPGGAFKVNWMDGVNGSGEMQLTLKGPSGATYSAHFAPNPSEISIPEPGCWELTVQWQGRTASTPLFLEPAQLTGLLAPGANNPIDPLAGGVTWADPGAAISLLNAAASKPGAMPTGRPAAEVFLLWKTARGPGNSPMLYLPANQGKPAMIAVGKNLVSGDCHDAATPVAAPIPADLARRLEEKLGARLDSSQPGNPWERIVPHCQTFTKQ